MMKSRGFTAGAVFATAPLVLVGCSDAGSADAEDFPEDDITLIVHADAGGGSDLSSRALATELEDILDVSVVVENRPGAAGSTAMEYLRDEDADGYTIGFAPVEVAMLGHQDYDIDPADYDFLSQIMLAPGVLVVPNDSPYTTLEEFVEGSQEENLAVGNSGAGSIWEAATLGLAEEAETQVEPVPFDGGAPAITAVIGGQVDAAVGGTAEVSQAAEDESLRPLAVFHDERHPDMPDVPTAAEEGFDLEFGGWGGIYAPLDLPEEARDTLEAAIEEAASSDSFVDTITADGTLPIYRDADEFTEFVTEEHERFGELLSDQ